MAFNVLKKKDENPLFFFHSPYYYFFIFFLYFFMGKKKTTAEKTEKEILLERILTLKYLLRDAAEELDRLTHQVANLPK